MTNSPDRSKREKQATEAVIALLDDAGVKPTDVSILRSENNVVLTATDDIVAKAIESDRPNALAKEAAVLSELRRHDETVNLSHLGGGPFEKQSWTIVLLERLNVIEREPSIQATHESLARLHRALSGVSLPLPSWLDQIRDTETAWRNNPLPDISNDVLNASYDRWIASIPTPDVPLQALHGDAWTRRLLWTDKGLRWIDFEAACIGPKELDLAAWDTVENYGEFDVDLWTRLKLLRSWTVAIWSHVNSEHSPQLKSHVDLHVRRLGEALDM